MKQSFRMREISLAVATVCAVSAAAVTPLHADDDRGDTGRYTIGDFQTPTPPAPMASLGAEAGEQVG
jgi:hypothetical protein